MANFSRRSVIALLAAFGGYVYLTRARGGEVAARLYADPLPKPDAITNVYHLGHSLVGRDMPAMLAQLGGHSHHSQLGWGTSLREHWDPDLPINGFDAENDHAHFRPAREAIRSGTYDAVILTEMVELRDAITYHDTPDNLANWAQLAHEANPQTRIYLYETWHHTDDPLGWFARLDQDFGDLWRDRVLHPGLAKSGAPIHLIPAGQVMAAFLRAVDARGGMGAVREVSDLFATAADGTPDTIHMNDLGAYLVALTHYAVLYHRSPVGLPHALLRADGTPATAPSPEVAALMQETVWRVIARHAETGVRV